MACPETRVGDGWEAQFATNHLGHFALVNRLWPLIAAAGAANGARVVSLSSTGHKRSPIRWDDVHFTAGDYEKWTAYGQAKTANALFAVQLDRLGESSGVRAFAVHPGGIMTPLQRHLPQEEMIEMGWVDADGNVNELFKSPTQGATTTLWCATSSQLDGMGGVYCEDCDISATDRSGEPVRPLPRCRCARDRPRRGRTAVGAVRRVDRGQRLRLTGVTTSAAEQLVVAIVDDDGVSNHVITGGEPYAAVTRSRQASS